MNFIAPLGFLALIGIPVVVIMYLLKLKRQRVVVPSTLLWRRAVQDLVANAPFQKLRNNLLLWLQLLVVALIALTLARPTLFLNAVGSRTVVLLIDTSASMQAKDRTGKVRMDAAKDAALRIIDGMGTKGGFFESMQQRDQAVVLAFNNKTQVVQTLTNDKQALRQAVRGLQAADTATDLREAALLLTDLTTQMDKENKRIAREDVRTVLISDGAVGVSAATLVDIPNLEYVKIGEATPNAGVTQLDIRQTYGTEPRTEIFATISYNGPSAGDRFIELQIEGVSVDVKKERLEPGKPNGVLFNVPNVQPGIASVILQGEDALAVDDIARGRITPRKPARVLLVSRSNRFLEQALAYAPDVDLQRSAPEAYSSATGDFDLVVFDNCPVPKLTAGAYWLINSLPPDLNFASKPEPAQDDDARIQDWNRVHPLTRYVNLDKVALGKSLRVEAPPSATVLAESRTGALISLYEKERLHVLVTSFNLFDSDWPLQASFPIFVSNAVEYFALSRQAGARTVYRTGDIVPLLSDGKSTKVRVQAPGGRETELPLDPGSTAYFTQTDRTGLYSIKYEKAEVADTIAVNLLSATESDVTPVDELDVGGRKLEGRSPSSRENREVWPWVLLAALAFLTTEWILYCRRAWL